MKHVQWVSLSLIDVSSLSLFLRECQQSIYIFLHIIYHWIVLLKLFNTGITTDMQINWQDFSDTPSEYTKGGGGVAVGVLNKVLYGEALIY